MPNHPYSFKFSDTFLGTTFLIFRAKSIKGIADARYRLIASLISLFAVGYYAMLLDLSRYFPNLPSVLKVDYLSSFTYYYFSSLVFLVILWLGFAWDVLLQIVKNHITGHRLVFVIGTTICIVITITNFLMFSYVNRLVQIIHTYPYSSESIHRQIIAKLPEIKEAEPGEVIVIRFVAEPDKLSGDFESNLQVLYGIKWKESGFYEIFSYYEANPNPAYYYFESLLRAYFPYNQFDIQLEKENDSGK